MPLAGIYSVTLQKYFLISDDHLLPVSSEIHGALNLRDSNSKFHADVT